MILGDITSWNILFNSAWNFSVAVILWPPYLLGYRMNWLADPKDQIKQYHPFQINFLCSLTQIAQLFLIFPTKEMLLANSPKKFNFFPETPQTTFLTRLAQFSPNLFIIVISVSVSNHNFIFIFWIVMKTNFLSRDVLFEILLIFSLLTYFLFLVHFLICNKYSNANNPFWNYSVIRVVNKFANEIQIWRDWVRCFFP